MLYIVYDKQERHNSVNKQQRECEKGNSRIMKRIFVHDPENANIYF